MKKQLEDLKKRIEKLDKEKQATYLAHNRIEGVIETLKEQQRNQAFFIENFDSENHKNELKQVDEITVDLLNMLDYQDFNKIKSAFYVKIQEQITDLGTQKNAQERNIRVVMAVFLWAVDWSLTFVLTKFIGHGA